MARATDVKARMVSAGEDLLSHRGYGVTMLEVIERADAPRGSIYYHFPDGKFELAVLVAQKVEREIDYFVDYVSAKVADPTQFLKRLVDHHRKRLVESDFELGCPLMGIIASGETEAQDLGEAVSAAFDTWIGAISRALTSKGISAAQSAQLASMTVTGIEGCIMVSRAKRSPQPFQDFSRCLPIMVANATGAKPAA